MIRVYLSGNPVHDLVLKAFFDGCTAQKTLVMDWRYEPSDVAVVFGVFKKRVRQSWPRGQVISQQRSKKLDVIVLETGYVNRGDGENHHYAAGWNGLNGRADFKNKGVGADRADLLGVDLQPFRQGENIILCGQVPWDASVDHSNHEEWLEKTAKDLNVQTTRNVIFRPHPLANLPPIRGCDYSTGPLWEDLLDAHSVVTFNSNSAVEALIAGIPVFAFDEGSMVWNVCNKSLKQIDHIWFPIRSQWLNELAYTQWTPQEMREGLAWKHLSQSRS